MSVTAPPEELGRGFHAVALGRQRGQDVGRHARLDVRANRTFNWAHKRLTLFAEVINLFDRDNVRFNPPGVSVTTRRVSNLFESMIPIVPSAGILIEF